MLCGKRCGCGLLHRFGRFFSDRTQIGILPLTRSAPFHIMPAVKTTKVFRLGGIAQLGERLHGMQEVSGSIPLISTNHFFRPSLFLAALAQPHPCFFLLFIRSAYQLPILFCLLPDKSGLNPVNALNPPAE